MHESSGSFTPPQTQNLAASSPSVATSSCRVSITASKPSAARWGKRRLSSCAGFSVRSVGSRSSNGHRPINRSSFAAEIRRNLLIWLSATCWPRYHLPPRRRGAGAGRTGWFRKPVRSQGLRGFESLPLRQNLGSSSFGLTSSFFERVERCPSGRRSTLGKRVCRKAPRVRIPPSPPFESALETGGSASRSGLPLNRVRPGTEQP